MYSMTWCAQACACAGTFVWQIWYMPALARLCVFNYFLIGVHLAVTHDTITTSLTRLSTHTQSKKGAWLSAHNVLSRSIMICNLFHAVTSLLGPWLGGTWL